MKNSKSKFVRNLMLVAVSTTVLSGVAAEVLAMDRLGRPTPVRRAATVRNPALALVAAQAAEQAANVGGGLAPGGAGGPPLPPPPPPRSLGGGGGVPVVPLMPAVVIVEPVDLRAAAAAKLAAYGNLPGLGIPAKAKLGRQLTALKTTAGVELKMIELIANNGGLYDPAKLPQIRDALVAGRMPDRALLGAIVGKVIIPEPENMIKATVKVFQDSGLRISQRRQIDRDIKASVPGISDGLKLCIMEELKKQNWVYNPADLPKLRDDILAGNITGGLALVAAPAKFNNIFDDKNEYALLFYSKTDDAIKEVSVKKELNNATGEFNQIRQFNKFKGKDVNYIAEAEKEELYKAIVSKLDNEIRKDIKGIDFLQYYKDNMAEDDYLKYASVEEIKFIEEGRGYVLAYKEKKDRIQQEIDALDRIALGEQQWEIESTKITDKYGENHTHYVKRGHGGIPVEYTLYEPILI